MSQPQNGLQDDKFKFAIVGGGICGLVLAVALLKRGLHVDIYEQAPRYGEIGAGIALSPNANTALEACSSDLLEAYQRVESRNQAPERQYNWFDWLDGYHNKGTEARWCFCLKNKIGSSSVHRAHFLDEIVKLVPEKVSHFGKRLDDIGETADGQLRLAFTDGSHATADAIIGCDGIKSRTRQILFGLDHPCAHPVYTHKYAYRGLIPMDKAAAALGENTARNAHMHMGQNGHVLTFPVAHGTIMNVVAFISKADDWPDYSRVTLPSTKASAYEDYKDFGGSVRAILDLLDDDLDRWGIFDSGHHSLSTYCKGRVCLLGDSAHASSPHQGAGAGLGIEDAAVMAEVLLSAVKPEEAPLSRTQISKRVEKAFEVFDESRRERTQWLVQSSRRAGDLYEWRAEGVLDDTEKIHEEIKWRCETIWNADVPGFIRDAKNALEEKIK